jgi:hypothetical protein
VIRWKEGEAKTHKWEGLEEGGLARMWSALMKGSRGEVEGNGERCEDDERVVRSGGERREKNETRDSCNKMQGLGPIPRVLWSTFLWCMEL